ncbi:MAG: hypothetical protein DRJ30_01725 [Candidatus Methanomethylicota archaeon]|nr:MAG: hypothetical protein DRJ30_01725 [Candidatus Verstraetearchaeota archaeon]
MPYPTEPVEILGAWVGAFLTIAIYSYILYRENLVFRFAEHTYIAVTFAVSIVQAVSMIQNNIIAPLSNGQLTYIVPIILGLMLYTLPFKQVRWMARYTVSFLVGIGFGVAIRGSLTASIIDQVLGSITPPINGSPLDWFNYIWIGLGFILVTMYFTFTVEHKGAYYYPTRLGRYILMLGLGVYFGNTVQFRMAMLSGRVQYLLQVFKIIPWP